MKKYIFMLSFFWAVSQLISAQTITHLEYSIDGIVAEGEGTPIELPGSSSEINTALNINISDLEPGIHTIHFRARNDEGIWSFAAERSFYIPEPPVADGIVAVEYAFDDKVKEGNGELIALDSGTNELDTTVLFDVSDLAPGVHNIYMRSKNIYGIWSFQASGTFVVLEPDTTKIEDIYYRIYNEDFESSWMVAQVDPARKNIDSTIMLSVAGLDFSENYSIELYAENSKDTRGYSVFLNDLSLQQNIKPVALKDTLELLMSENQNLLVSMDTLFNDPDLMVGDSLRYKIVWADSVGLFDFSTWENDAILSLMPGSGQGGIYQFMLETTDLAFEADSLLVMLTVTGTTGINPTSVDNRFVIYPNPARDFIKIITRNNNVGSYELKLYNTYGQLLLSKHIAEKEFVMDVSDYTSGVYFLLLINDEAPYKRKILVE